MLVITTAVLGPFGFGSFPEVKKVFSSNCDEDEVWCEYGINNGSCVKDHLTCSRMRGETNEEGRVEPNEILKEFGINCRLLPWPTLSDCLAEGTFHLSSLSSVVLTASGNIFNFFTHFSMRKDVIDQKFVTDSWKVMRDLANMMFILLMVVIAISIILDMGTFANKQLVVGVIIAALAVNFSLFVSKVVIDAGNIIALGFYDAVSAETHPNDTKIAETNKSGDGIEISKNDLSGSFVAVFSPVEIIDGDTFKKAITNIKSERQKKYVFTFTMLLLLATALYASYIFFLAGFLFASRVGMLWVLMIVSPLAVVLRAVPGKGSGYFDKWWGELISKSFGIVPFMFMMWLMAVIINKGLFTSNIFSFNASSITDGIVGWMSVLIEMGIKFVVVITLLQIAMKLTKAVYNDGGLGDKAFGFVKKVGLGVATGGGAVLAKNTVSRLGGKAVKAMENRGVGTGRVGRLALKGARNIENAKYGSKESLKEKDARIAADRMKEMKGIKNIKDAQGNIIVDRQQQFRDTMLKGKPSLIAFMTGQRAGEKAFVEGYNKIEVLKTELNSSKNILDRSRDQLKKAKKRNDNNPGSVTPAAMDALRSRVNTEEEKINSLKENLKKTQEKFKPKKK